MAANTPPTSPGPQPTLADRFLTAMQVTLSEKLPHWFSEWLTSEDGGQQNLAVALAEAKGAILADSRQASERLAEQWEKKLDQHFEKLTTTLLAKTEELSLRQLRKSQNWQKLASQLIGLVAVAAVTGAVLYWKDQRSAETRDQRIHSLSAELTEEQNQNAYLQSRNRFLEEQAGGTKNPANQITLAALHDGSVWVKITAPRVPDHRVTLRPPEPEYPIRP